jgi:hypothetical protein
MRNDAGLRIRNDQIPSINNQIITNDQYPKNKKSYPEDRALRLNLRSRNNPETSSGQGSG